MAEKIRVNYQALQEMAQLCSKTAQFLEESTVKKATNAGQQMANGALVGEVGEAMADALRGPFSSSVKKLGAKFEEISRDIRMAIRDMRAADRDAAGQF